jgi:hypothetical protein
MDEQLSRKVRFLQAANTETMPHTEHGLLDHLLGTRQLLVDWGADASVCDAGLFHSVYGTEHYEPKAIPLSMRAEVRQLIGEQAEALAWIFCIMRRETFDENLGHEHELSVRDRLTGERVPLTRAQFHDLVTITFANTLQAFPRLSWSMPRNCRAYLRPFCALAAPAARNAFNRSDSKWWEVWK